MLPPIVGESAAIRTRASGRASASRRPTPRSCWRGRAERVRSCSRAPSTSSRPARAASRSSRSTAPRFPRRSSRASCSATSAAPSPGPRRGGWVSSSSATAGRSSWTRSASYLRRLRASCCASCRSVPSTAWAARSRSRSTSASSPRRTVRSKRWWPRACSATTSTTGSGCFRSASPPLRERPEDVDPLIDWYLEHLPARARQEIRDARARGPGAPARLRLAGERPRAAQLPRASNHSLRRRRHRREPPAHRPRSRILGLPARRDDRTGAGTRGQRGRKALVAAGAPAGEGRPHGGGPDVRPDRAPAGSQAAGTRARRHVTCERSFDASSGEAER